VREADLQCKQQINVPPDPDMAVVFTGNYVQDDSVDEIVTRFILPAVQ
jgi:hypothetical protein